MKTLIAAALLVSLSGCSTMMNDRITDVSVLSEPSGQRYSITDQDGRQVRTGTTPDSIKLDAAAGFFDGQTYQVQYEKSGTVELDSQVSPWYFLGIAVDGIFSLFIDQATGDAFTLPAVVKGGSK